MPAHDLPRIITDYPRDPWRWCGVWDDWDVYLLCGGLANWIDRNPDKLYISITLWNGNDYEHFENILDPVEHLEMMSACQGRGWYPELFEMCQPHISGLIDDVRRALCSSPT